MSKGFWGSSGFVPTEKELAPRQAHDFYPTPRALVRAALERLPIDFVPKRILDPGAGLGVWGESARLLYPAAGITAVEIRKEALTAVSAFPYDEYRTTDFLTLQIPPGFVGYDLVMGNPPYKFAQEFVERSLSLARSGGYVLFLLRLAFLEGQERYKSLHIPTPPMKVYALVERPSFLPHGRTDATAYALYLWRKGWQGTTELHWLHWR